MQFAYFVNNGLQGTSMNRCFLNIIHKMVQVLQQQFIGCFREQIKDDLKTREPQTGGLSVNSTADSLSLNFLVYFGKMSRYFSRNFLQIQITSKRIYDWELLDITVHQVS